MQQKSKIFACYDFSALNTKQAKALLLMLKETKLTKSMVLCSEIEDFNSFLNRKPLGFAGVKIYDFGSVRGLKK